MDPRGKPWPKGVSGNKSGRPPGSKNKSTVILEKLLEEWGEQISKKTIQMALKGNVNALKLLLDRITPPKKDRTINFELPDIDTTADLTKATSALLHGVAAGDITPSEASELGRLVEVHMKAIETADLAARIHALEVHSSSGDPAGGGDDDSET